MGKKRVTSSRLAGFMRSAAKKAEILRMPLGTAGGRLRKSIMFKLAQMAGQDVCFRCQAKIATVDEFSIEHKINWMDHADPVGTFFDLDNISFSHHSCNVRASRRPNKKYANRKEKVHAEYERQKHNGVYEKKLEYRKQRYHRIRSGSLEGRKQAAVDR